MSDKEYVMCYECPHCKPRGIRGKGCNGEGYRYGICQKGGNVVFLEPWKEKKIHGFGYRHHEASTCGMYEK